MEKIEKLTEAQAARLPEFRREYYRHGTSTAPADRARAEAAFARAYRTIGREPVPVIWVASPLTASLAFAALEHSSLHKEGLAKDVEASLRVSLDASLSASLEASLSASLEASLRASLDASLWASLEASLWASLWASLGVSLWASLHVSLQASLWESLGVSLWASLRASLQESLQEWLFASMLASLRKSEIKPKHTNWLGQQDLYWIAYYKFCADIGVKYDAEVADKLDIMHEIALSCMWWYPVDDLIVACDRPEHIYTDDRERLHNDTGPAISFRDGWKIYAVHGVRVPGWVFEEPHRLTVEAIDAEGNSEIRRVMIERFGWDRYAEECGAEIVDHDERWGTLMRSKNKAGEPMLFLRVVNRSPEPDGSFRKYVLPVDTMLRPIPDPSLPNDHFGEPQRLTALNAVASSFGMRGEEYAAMIGAES